MASQTIVDALLLGILEGLTEFIPVSSTGHILLAGHFLGFESTGKAFEVLIQLGAILAILSVYFARLWSMLVSLPSDRGTQYFVGGILLAFLPAVLIAQVLPISISGLGVRELLFVLFLHPLGVPRSQAIALGLLLYLLNLVVSLLGAPAFAVGHSKAAAT